jgi:hypothetical protein
MSRTDDCQPEPNRLVSRQRAWFRTALLVLAAFLAVNIPLVLGIYTGLWDAAQLHCPFQMLIGDCAREGRLLLWTPLVNGGYPGVDPICAAFSPLAVGVGALCGGHEFGFRVYWLLVWGLGGVGVVLLARHLSAPPWVARVAALGLLFSGIYVAHAESTSFLPVFSLFPWVLWRLDVALLRRSLLAAAEAGALFGLSALGGYPGLIVIGLGYAALWMAARFFEGLAIREEGDSAGVPGNAEIPVGQAGRGIRQFGRQLGLLVVVSVIFLALSAIVMLPTYAGFLVESRGYSDRSQPLPRVVAISENALHPLALCTFASPFLAVLKVADPGHLYPGTDVTMCDIYLFPGVLVLAALAVWQRSRDRFRWCLAAIAVLCLACALGGTLPLRGWLYDWLPPMRYFRHPAIFRCYYLITAVVLALLAGRDLQAGDPAATARAWKKFAILGALGTAAAFAAFAAVCWVAPSLRGVWNLLLAMAHMAAIWLGVIIIARLGCRGEEGLRSRLLEKHLFRLAIADAILTVIISKPVLYTKRAELWEAAEKQHVAALDLTERGLDRQPFSTTTDATAGWLPTPLLQNLAHLPPSRVLGVSWNANLVAKVPILWGYSPLSNHYYTKTCGDAVLANAALGARRIWFSPQAANVPLSDAAFERLAKRSGQLGRPCLVVSSPDRLADADAPPAADKIEKLPAAQPASVKLLAYGPEELAFDVSCPGDGWLLVTDRWARGWRVTVNGRPQAVSIGNFVFRAVPVAAGINHLCFTYRPFGHPWFLLASWGTLGVLMLAPLGRTIFSHRHAR